MSITLSGYYDRFDPDKQFERHLFRAGNVIQSAEFNEVQSASMHRLKGVADALFVDGDILKNAGLSFDPNTGLCVCDAGEVYVNGAVRSVGATTLTLPTTGTVLVGVRLIDTVITEAEDASLLDPACEMPNRQEPGAARLKAHLEWGWNGDGKGEMTAVYVIIDGEIQAKVNGSHHHAISHIAGLQESLDAITVTLTGDVTGESGVDDDGLISITATVADNSHNHVIDNIDGLDVLTEGGVTSENPSGFFKLLNGLLVQFGGMPTDANGVASTTFPVPFTRPPWSVTVTVHSPVPLFVTAMPTHAPEHLTSLFVKCIQPDASTPPPAGQHVTWIAIGI